MINNIYNLALVSVTPSFIPVTFHGMTYFEQVIFLTRKNV